MASSWKRSYCSAAVPSALSEMARMMIQGRPFRYAVWAIAAPSISQHHASNFSRISAFFCAEDTKQSPLATRPRNTPISGFSSRQHCSARSTSSGAARKKLSFIRGITPGAYPNPTQSMSCCTASVDRTISPTFTSSCRPPAIPVFMIMDTPNLSARIWAQAAALTFPMPEHTTVLFFPQSIPV